MALSHADSDNASSIISCFSLATVSVFFRCAARLRIFCECAKGFVWQKNDDSESVSASDTGRCGWTLGGLLYVNTDSSESQLGKLHLSTSTRCQKWREGCTLIPNMQECPLSTSGAMGCPGAAAGKKSTSPCRKTEVNHRLGRQLVTYCKYTA